jgi:hypothetical protein
MASARRLLAGEKSSEQMLKELEQTYNSMMDDPRIKSGAIGDYLKREDLSYFSKNDKDAISKAIAHGTYNKVKYSRVGTVVTLEDTKYNIGGKKSQIDFRDFASSEHGTIYVNGEKYELSLLVPGNPNAETQIQNQLKDFEKFAIRKKMQAFFPGLSDQQSLWAYNGLQIILFPLTALSGCSEKSKNGESTGFLSIFPNIDWCWKVPCKNNLNNFKNRPSHDHGSPIPLPLGNPVGGTTPPGA